MNMIKKLKNDNTGFSFIEFLVSFAILVVLINVASFSLGLTAGTQAKEVTQTINAMISRTKVGTLTRTGEVYMKIYMNSGSEIVCEYYENGWAKEAYTCSTSDKVQVGYSVKGDSTVKLLSAGGEALYLSFDRQSTGFQTIGVGSGYDGVSSHSVSDKFCEEIYIWGGKQTGSVVDYSISLGSVTGTHFMNGLK